ncbi:MAG: hypothetical protein H7256_01155 [Bdellovibrio sp.]|nr:hypothetical protein [Bdellovibrio sp.]
MKLQIVIIDEPIHIENPIACQLWQKTLWAKEKGYRKHYQTSIMPIGVEDFFGTHYIVAEVKSNGNMEPVGMLKCVRRSQSERFSIPFAPAQMLKSVGKDRDENVQRILNSPDEVSYVSSWTTNPDYKKDAEFSALLKDYMTVYACNYFKDAKIPRWLAAGVTQFKMDKYLESLGGKEIVPEFSLPIIDNQTVRMMLIADPYNPPPEHLVVASTLQSAWDNRIIFSPNNTQKGAFNVVRAA